MKFSHDRRSQLDQVSAHGAQLLEVFIVETSVGLENRIHLRLNVAALVAVMNGFCALLQRKSEQQTHGDCCYMNSKTFPGMNGFVGGMGFEHGC
jgi:hypothetical protein